MMKNNVQLTKEEIQFAQNLKFTDEHPRKRIRGIRVMVNGEIIWQDKDASKTK